MDISAAKLAVDLALSGKWDEAIKVNLAILKDSPDDADALCRLARAYSEIGKLSQAKNSTKKALEIDPANPIAIKFLEKLKHSKKKDAEGPSTRNESFVEEPGKTKLIELLNLGRMENYIHIDPGEEVRLTSYSHRVSVTATDGNYIGRLPDDIAARLKFLIKKGNKYQTLIKSVSPKSVAIFVREIEKGIGAPDFTSFPPEKIEYVSFTPPELVHKDTPDVETTEEIPEE